MRVGIVVGAFPALSETFILNQVTGLLDRGLDVEIIASRPGPAGVVHPDVEAYFLMRRVRYRPEWPSGRFARLGRGLRLAIANGRRDGRGTLRCLNIGRYGRSAASLRLLYAATPFLTARRFDILHCHFGPIGAEVASLREALRLPGRLVTTFHGFEMSADDPRSARRRYGRLFAQGDLFLPVSERWRRRLLEWGCDNNRLFVHRMGVDCRRLHFVPRVPEADGTIRLLSIARLVEKKGIDIGIRAVARLAGRYPNIRYCVVGDGPLRGELERVAAESGIAERVRLLGWRDHEAVQKALYASHVLVAPSVTTPEGEQEGIPVALMEAMASGMPVVSTRHSGIPELVEDGVSGVLVAEGDVQGLADGLEQLITHAEAWPKMGGFGRRRIEAHHDIEQLNDRLVILYEKVLATDKQLAEGRESARRRGHDPGTTGSLQEY